MRYGLEELAEVLKIFLDNNVRLTIIGDTCIQLALKKKFLEGDLDLFVSEPSPLVEEDFYRGLAEEMGWGYSYTEIGTPRIIARVNEKEIVLEFYENFMDIEIPVEIIEEARSITVSGAKIKILYPEQYFVLKARQGVDLDKLSKYLRELKRLDIKRLRKSIEKYPREEQGLIVERLRDIGVNI